MAGASGLQVLERAKAPRTAASRRRATCACSCSAIANCYCHDNDEDYLLLPTSEPIGGRVRTEYVATAVLRLAGAREAI